MGCKTLIGRALSMQSTPLGPCSVGGGGQRGTGRGGPPGSYGRVAERYPLEGDKVRKGVKNTPLFRLGASGDG